jgi:hypothetical protein
MCIALGAGFSDVLVRGVVQALGEHNAAWYAQLGGRSPASSGLLYVMDRPGELVELVDAAELAMRGRGSCGSLAAAYYGWLRAKGDKPRIIITRPEDEVWHCKVAVASGFKPFALTAAARREAGMMGLWDPEKELRHASP